MRYNMSEIMKAAWKMKKFFKKFKCITFSECLKKAWAEAKEAASIEEQGSQKFENGMTVCYHYQCDTFFTLNRWTKYGKDRIYVNFCNGKTLFYYDLIGKKAYAGKDDGTARVTFLTKIIEKMNIEPIKQDKKQNEWDKHALYKTDDILGTILKSAKWYK